MLTVRMVNYTIGWAQKSCNARSRLRQFIWVCVVHGWQVWAVSLCGDQGTGADMIATSQDINYCLNTLYTRQTIRIQFLDRYFLLDIKIFFGSNRADHVGDWDRDGWLRQIGQQPGDGDWQGQSGHQQLDHQGAEDWAQEETTGIKHLQIFNPETCKISWKYAETNMESGK